MKTLSFLILFCCNLSAETALSWKDCVNEVQKNNPELRSYISDVRSKEYGVKESYSYLLPQIGASIGHQQGTTYTSSNITPSYSARLYVTQNIFNSFYDYARIKSSKALLESSNASLEATKANVSYDLKNAYVSLIYSKKSLELNKNIMKRRQDNLNVVELRFESGRENKGSLLLSKAYMEQARYEHLQAENNIEVTTTNLARVLGRPEATNFNVLDDIPIKNEVKKPNFEDIAINTPEYKLAIAKENSALASLTEARSGFLPSLTFSGEYGSQDTKWFPSNKVWSLGLSLSMPIFNSGRDYYATKGASASVESEIFSRQDLLNRLVTRLKRAYDNYMEAIQKHKVDESFLKALTVRAEIARSMYGNGLMNFTDWDIIENDLINRQKNELSSYRDKVVKEAEWEQIQGKGVLL